MEKKHRKKESEFARDEGQRGHAYWSFGNFARGNMLRRAFQRSTTRSYSLAQVPRLGILTYAHVRAHTSAVKLIRFLRTRIRE